jgi:predicted nucleic acid-binding protein
MLVVADAGPLIALNGIDRLYLLRDLYGNVLAPPAVLREISPSVESPPDWIIQTAPTGRLPMDLLESRLGDGEVEAIQLARQVSADWLLLDDLDARRWALARNLPVVGTVGVLVRARENRLVPAVRPLLDALIRNRNFIGASLYEGALRSAGEIP